MSLRKLLFGASAVGAAVTLAGCGNSGPRPGAMCEVQIQRNLLGASDKLPVPPETSSINGASVSVSGKLVSIDDQWVVLQAQDNGTIYVPRNAVLLIKQSPAGQ